MGAQTVVPVPPRCHAVLLRVVMPSMWCCRAFCILVVVDVAVVSPLTHLASHGAVGWSVGWLIGGWCGGAYTLLRLFLLFS